MLTRSSVLRVRLLIYIQHATSVSFRGFQRSQLNGYSLNRSAIIGSIPRKTHPTTHTTPSNTPRPILTETLAHARQQVPLLVPRTLAPVPDPVAKSFTIGFRLSISSLQKSCVDGRNSRIRRRCASNLQNSSTTHRRRFLLTDSETLVQPIQNAPAA